MKSLRLYARNEYDERNWFAHQFFPDKSVSAFKRIMLRNGSNDRTGTTFRDPLIQLLVQHLSFDTQYYQPAIVFVNGEYWGVHNVRDRYDRYYLETRYGVDGDNLDLLQLLREDSYLDAPSRHDVSEGDEVHFDAMMDFVKTHDLADEANYAHLRTLMDVRNFMEFNVAQIYVDNTDWPGKNVRYWRVRTGHDPNASYGHDGRWRWMMFDTEFGFGNGRHAGATGNTLAWATATDGGIFNPPEATLLLRKLLANEGFRNEFTNTMADQINTAFVERHNGTDR